MIQLLGVNPINGCISAFHPALYVYTRPMNEFKVNLNMDMTTQY